MQWNNWKYAGAVASLAVCLTSTRAQAGLVPANLALDSATTASQPEPQAKDDLLDGMEKLGTNARERNEVNLDKNMMALMGHKGSRYSDLSQKIDTISVRNYEFAGKGMYSKSDLDALRHRMDGNGWSHLVRNESDGETNDIVVKSAGDGFISDMVILNAEAKEVNIVHLRGHFHMDDVNGAMGATMGMNAGTLGMAGAMGHTTSHRSSSPSTTTSTTTTSTTVPTPPEPPAKR